jgi:hypothetical protein
MYLAPGSPLAGQLQTGQGIQLQQLLVHGPIQDVPQNAQITVDRGVLNGPADWLRFAFAPEFLGHGLGQLLKVQRHTVGAGVITALTA